MNDYPVDLRADYTPRSSRLWAVLTILWIKMLLLIPHGIALVFLGIAEVVIAFVGQVVVIFTGAYPSWAFDFVIGVERWSARVSAYLYSLTDRYPPFALRSDPSYPIDVLAVRPQKSSRIYAIFTVIVQVVVVIVVMAIVISNAGSNREPSLSTSTHITTSGLSSETQLGAADDTVRFRDSGSRSTNSSRNTGSRLSGGLVLRQIAALPHLIVVALLALAALVVWIIVQWIILVAARYPRGLFDFSVGVMRWATRVSIYAMGAIDKYPPFTFAPSLSAAGPAGGAPWTPAGPVGGAPWTPGGPGGSGTPSAPGGPGAPQGPAWPQQPTSPPPQQPTAPPPPPASQPPAPQPAGQSAPSSAQSQPSTQPAAAAPGQNPYGAPSAAPPSPPSPWKDSPPAP